MKSGGKAYVIGAGLAGLAAATGLAARGTEVTLFEAAGQAGGRCRSYFDPNFDGVIDNGNHLVLSGNRAIHTYLDRIGATANLSGPVHALFDFVDLKSGARWTLKPNEGPLPWWIGSALRRVPGTSPRDYLAYVRLLFAGKRQTLGDVMACKGDLWDRLMHPFLLAALNTEPCEASARLAGAILKETLVKGGRAYRPRIATPTLAAAFVDPALAFLAARNAKVRFNERLRAITFGRRAAAALEFPDATMPLARTDAIILAVPPWVAKEHRQRAFQISRAARGARHPWGHRRHRGMDLQFRRPHLRHGFGCRRAGGSGPRGAGPEIVGRCREGAWDFRCPAEMADRQGKARHLCRHAGPGRQAATHQKPLAQFLPGGRLDRYRASRHYRGRGAVRRGGGGYGAAPSVFIVRL
jgi:hypothetical protein